MTQTLRLFTVDAFTRERFRGNPAAVCPLERWLPDALMQKIAAENNLAETAFFVPNDTGFHLRWFTPKVEVDLCGHATLASAHVLVNHLSFRGDVIRFDSRSGPLAVRRDDDRFVLDFPSQPPEPCEAPDALVQGLGGIRPRDVGRGMDYFAVLDSEGDVRRVSPDLTALKRLDRRGVIVTAGGASAGVDFVSRFFAPRAGIDEDSATGSSHCALIPYWAAKLGKTKMLARQLSERGAEFFCEFARDRVLIGGHAVTYLIGEISI